MAKRSSSKRSADWSAAEVVLGYQLYLQLGDAPIREDDPRVVALSADLGSWLPASAPDRDPSYRNPAGVARRLRMFSLLDARGPDADVPALYREVWLRYRNSPTELDAAARFLRGNHLADPWLGVRPAIEPTYFALLAVPDVYDIERAVAELDEDEWGFPRIEVTEGDRGIIWRASGIDGRRGIIALAELLETPAMRPRSDINSPYWVTPPTGGERRSARVRYVVPEGLPLWLGDYPDLAHLSVAKASGGSDFYLTKEDWEHINSLLGSPLPPRSNQQLRLPTRRTGQGRNQDPVAKRAIELRAMTVVTDYYQQLGHTVKDASVGNPYDLVCTKEGKHLRVEVKGTTGSAPEVFLTANEVAHARANRDIVALAIVTGIAYDRDKQVAGGGVLIGPIMPWDVDKGSLAPTQFRHIPKL